MNTHNKQTSKAINIKKIFQLKGFTLIELVMVITISAILSGSIAVFIIRPINAYTSVTQRAQLVDAADLAIRRMTRDIQRAVPNSIRVKTDPLNPSRVAIEMVNIVEGMRYRAAPTGSAGSGPFLSFTQTNTQFNVIGQFKYALSNATCAVNGCRIVIYNTGANTGGAIPSDNPAPGANVYSTAAAPACGGGAGTCIPPQGSYTITPVATTVTLTNPGAEGQVTLGTATQFALPSPRQRLDVVDTPVTYVCDYSAGQQNIFRYWNYVITPVQPTDPTVSPLVGGSSAQLTQNTSFCNFAYSPGTAQNNGIVSLTITLSKGGQTVTLMRQISVSNVP